MKYLFLFFLAVMVDQSCKQKPAAEAPAETKLSEDLQHYEDEVMKIHDDVMPKMSEIQRLSSQLREIKSKAGETGEGTPVMIEGLDDALQSLEKAEQGMMNWMKNYSETKQRITPDLLQIFYERELEKITHIKDNMHNSIDKANAWLAQHKGSK